MKQHNKIARRQFLKQASLATAGTMTLPLFLQASQPFYQPASGNQKLVVIQLSGGNDGLNAIVPYTNDIYYKKRPSIAVEASKVLKANSELGFNPKLSILRELYDAGELCVVNNIGYPNPDRSHFRSMDIWQTASDANTFLSTGWLGRYLDGLPQQQAASNTHAVLELDDTLSLALKGAQHNGFAMRTTEQLRRTTRSKIIQAVAQHPHNHDHDDMVSYLYQTLNHTVASADYLFETSKTYNSSISYPKNQLGRDLHQVARLLTSGCTTQVYYVSVGGFDTHINQVNQQDRLFQAYSEAVTAFVKDLKAQGQWKDTLVMTFSEFGRRVEENSSKGTDHGKGNNLYLMGGSLKQQGFYNKAPNLAQLDNGDVQFEVDFRRVYADILKNWLQSDANQILGATFKPLGVV